MTTRHTEMKEEEDIYVTPINFTASPPVGLVWLAVPVSPANEAQPCQLRLHIVLLIEELNRLQLDGPVFLFGYRGATEPILTADIQQIVSVCFCQIEAKLANVSLATYY